MSKRLTRKALLAKLDALQPISDEQRNKITCSLIGHSRIQTICFGYFYCARCEAQVGDNLAGLYPGAEKAVVVGHDCDTCHANYAECTWEDKLFAPDPFAKVAQP